MTEQMPSEKENVKLQKIHWASYMLYYMVLFFAHWFGASRFDMDGDGDFDPSDVEAFLKDKHLFLEKNYKRSEAAVMRSQLTRSPSNLSRNPSRKGTNQSQMSSQSKITAQKDSKKNIPTQPAAQPAQKVAAGELRGTANTQGGEHKPEDGHHGDGQQSMGQRLSQMLDRDGDGDVDAADLIFSAVEGGHAEEEEAIKALTSGQIIPLFTLGECLVCGVLWIIWAGIKSGESGNFFSQKAGLDSFWDKQTDLRFYGYECVDLRPQIWRWFTYQWTHIGATHVVMNILLLLMLGVPLEGVDGHLRLAVMFNLGVIGGALCNMVGDGHNAVVGCSGGVYALIGIHLADLIMNWAQKRFRLPTLILLIVLICADIGSNAASHTEGVSHSAHVGGAIMGLLAGICLGKNMIWKWHEKVLATLALVVGIGLTIFCLAWLYTREHGAESIFDGGVAKSCWVQQVWNSSWNVPKYQCVKCSTRDCVLYWQSAGLNAWVDEAVTCPGIGYRFIEGQ